MGCGEADNSYINFNKASLLRGGVQHVLLAGIKETVTDSVSNGRGHPKQQPLFPEISQCRKLDLRLNAKQLLKSLWSSPVLPSGWMQENIC